MSQKNDVSSSFLKIFALITMFIDHFGAVIIYKLIVYKHLYQLQDFYMLCRIIGRLAFPIFCFLLVEGYKYTRNKYKYAIRLGIFCLISEIPFDLAFNKHFLEFSSQNVFFTLLIGFLGMMVLEKICSFKILNKNIVMKFLKFIVCIVVGFMFCGIAKFLHTDYGAMGVLVILSIFALNQKSKLLAIFVSCILLTIYNSMEMISFLLLIPIFLYKGRKGCNIKWISYLFYPIHLIILSIVAYFI